ncbi:MAG: putative peptidoglycan glycosyltransferase FtsW [Gemmatimonadaceae bacterium]
MTASPPAVRERWRMTLEARALIITTGVILAYGLAVLYSASALAAVLEHHPNSYYLVRQLSGVAIGTVLFAIAAKVDAERWRGWAWPILILAIVLLVIPVLPVPSVIAPRLHGSRRWVNIGFLFQSSEFAKLACIIWTAMLIVKKGDKLRRLTKGLLPFVLILALLNLLVILEPDLSMAMTFTLIMGIMLFAGGVRIGHVIFLGIIAIPVLWHEVEKMQYALLRMTSWLNPGDVSAQASYQLKQSLIAVGSGGLFGVGFGMGRQQLGFVPFPYNDFIAANIGEEWGFFGIVFITLTFAVYGWIGFRIAKQARTTFQQQLAIGITFMTVSTAFLHLGVVIGLLPTTGLTLPFVSFGRTNLVMSILMTGILVNIASTRERVVGEHATNPLERAAA